MKSVQAVKDSNKQLYIVRKYVVAKSLKDALIKEKTTPVHDCWLDEKPNIQLQSMIGFTKDK